MRITKTTILGVSSLCAAAVSFAVTRDVATFAAQIASALGLVFAADQIGS